VNNTYNSKFKYAVLGIIFGSLFPVLATIIDLSDSALKLCLFNIFVLHTTKSLHLIIDTAPFFLGLFAYLIGFKQDQSDYNNQLYNELMERNMKNLSYLNQELEKKIDEHRKLSIALQKSEKRFFDIALSSADWIWEIDKYGKYSFATGRVKDILGYEPEELIGKSLNELLPKNEVQEVMEPFLKLIREKKPLEGLVHKHYKKSGELVYLKTDGVPILDSNGELLGYRGIDKDITQQVKNEEQKHKLQAQLERAKRMESLGVLAGGVAHDLNNMLGPIVAYPDFIAEKLPSDSPLIKQVISIKDAARRAAAVIQDLLTLARRGRYEMSSLDLNQIIESYIKSPVHIKFADEHPDILVTLDLDMSINNINGSFHHLSKVIMNLIINAFDAMPSRGELTVQTSQRILQNLYGGHNKIENGEYVILSIKDNGVGIAPEDLN